MIETQTFRQRSQKWAEANHQGLYRAAEYFMPRSGRQVIPCGRYVLSVTGGKNVPPASEVKNIAFVPGPGIGDILVMTPTFQLIKELCPWLNVSVFISRDRLPLIKGIPGVDNVILMKENGEEKPTACSRFFTDMPAAVIDDSRAGNNELYIWSWTDQTAPVVTEMLKAVHQPKISGVIHNPPNLVDTYVAALGIGLPPKLIYEGISGGLALLLPFLKTKDYLPPVADHYLQPNLSQELFGESAMRAFREKFRGAADLSAPLIYVNVLASHYGKMYSPESAAKLVARIAQDSPAAQILLNRGTKFRIPPHPQGITEEQYSEDVMNRCSGNDNITLLPAMSIAEIAQLLSLSRLLITMDTSISHLAASKQLAHLPSLVLFKSAGVQAAWGIKRQNRHYQSLSPRDYEYKSAPFEITDATLRYADDIIGLYNERLV